MGTDVARWAAGGALALSGPPEGRPLGPPDLLVAGLDAVTVHFPGLDGVQVLAERAALTGLTRRGRTSCGGATRLLQAADGWLAVSLPRATDLDLLPAWLPGRRLEAPDPARAWAAVRSAVAEGKAAELAERAIPLGLAVAMLPPEGSTPGRSPVLARRLGDAPGRDDLRGLRVVDLTSLWAGPLCGDLLGRLGADVIKVESVHRPDGARSGSPDFFALLNGGKRSVALDFAGPAGRAALARLVASADVVLEASRPRALEQLGLKAADVTGPQIWVSITGYGRDAPLRVAFGDDAAVGGGLVVSDDSGPYFCADAVADPATGLTAAHACVEALRQGGRWLLDIAMSAVAAELSGPSRRVPRDNVAEAPRARSPRAPAAPLGADTATVLAALP